MTVRITIRKGEYHDSVRLMQASQQLRRQTGVEEAIMMMATDSNKKILAAAGMSNEGVETAARDDLVIGVIATDEDAAQSALALADELLHKGANTKTRQEFPSLEAALEETTGANFALISIPGEYASEEAKRALDSGLNVMLFSDNISIADELELKQLASKRGLLLMGPDCGTAILNGCGLGFSNAVRQGRIGLVGASGTGLQEISTQIDRLGAGVSHAIGVGGRDAKREVGGISMLRALEMLAADSGTDIIVLTSKPPDSAVAKTVLAQAATCGKPVIVNFLGAQATASPAKNLTFAKTLSDAAVEAVRLAGNYDQTTSDDADILSNLVLNEVEKLGPKQKHVRGLYSGGTLCYEAMLLLQDQSRIYSNISISPDCQLDDPTLSRENTLLDLGDDFFTQGRAHPMIDPEQRNQRLLREADDETVAVVLFDLVIGYGAHPNPAEDLTNTILNARRIAAENGRQLLFVASICGTQQDHQDFNAQKSLLKSAGVIVAASNAEAVALVKTILENISNELGS